MFVGDGFPDARGMTDLDRRSDVVTAIAATFVLGLEPAEGSVTGGDYQVAVQRLQRAVRPWDSVVPLSSPRTIGVLCTALSGPREVDAIAERLADVVRAPMAVGDAIRTVGVCVGSALVEPGEAAAEAFDHAAERMDRMRHARAGLLAPDVPPQRITLA